MKQFKWAIGFLILISGTFFTGCYTQMATRDYDHERYTTRDEQEDYQADNDTTYDDSDNYDDATINNYYGYPGYNRYYWHYYPGVSFGFYNPFYYDPFYYDPWNYWCAPIYYSYDPFFRFPYYGYYGGYAYYDGYGYYGGGHNIIRERGNDIQRIRGYGGRTSLARGGMGLTRGTLARTFRERNGNTAVVRDRNAVRDRSADLRKNTAGRSFDKPAVRKNIDGNSRPGLTRGNRTEAGRKEVNRGSRSGRGNPGTYQQPRRNNPPRTYSPPQRTYSPPRSSAPRSGGAIHSSPPSRGGGSGSAPSRGGGGSSGRRR